MHVNFHSGPRRAAIFELLTSRLADFAREQAGGHFQIWPDGRVSLELEDCDFYEIAGEIANLMAPRTVDQIVGVAEELLRTARFGLEDLRSNTERRRAGLLNAIVFGRSATFALQNLRSVVPEFEDWYRIKREEMRQDDLMVFFNELRRKIEHAAETPGSSVGHFHHFGTSLAGIGPAPPGATGFIMGDQNGGSCWVIGSTDGTPQKSFTWMFQPAWRQWIFSYAMRRGRHRLKTPPNWWLYICSASRRLSAKLDKNLFVSPTKYLDSCHGADTR